MADGGSDRVAEKRRRILAAARHLMLKQGLRSTTMELIAREAGIAKPTLYAQFADKDAVLTGIIGELLVELDTAFSAGLAGPGNVAERVGAALAGKYTVIARLLAGSPHLRDFDEGVERRIADALAEAGVEEPPGLARLAIAASYGIGSKLAGEREIGEAIRVVCRRLIEQAAG